MKKFLTVLLVLVLGIGGGIGMYALTLYLNGEEGIVEQLSNKKDKETNQADNNLENNNNPGTVKDVSKYVFVGDSRYVGMKDYANEDDIFICEVGEGYNFLESNIDNIKSSVIDENTVIIIGLGINDFTYNFDSYVVAINALASEVPCQVCYMLVNPVDEDIIQYNGYDIKNDEIDEFNNRMSIELDPSVKIIDTNSYLKNNGYRTEDGLHYETDTYKSIYDYIKVCVTNS